MPSILKRPGYGNILVEKSWATANGNHICELVGGGYCFTSGAPVTKLSDLNGIAMSEEEWQKAVDHFDAEKQRAEEKPRNIQIMKDGFAWSDGTPITQYNEITQNIPPGPMQEAALDWFAEQRKKQVKLEKVLESPVGEAAEEVAAAPPKKKAAPSKKRKAPKAAPKEA